MAIPFHHILDVVSLFSNLPFLAIFQNGSPFWVNHEIPTPKGFISLLEAHTKGNFCSKSWAIFCKSLVSPGDLADQSRIYT
jgi:hypothetical protein